ncbi:MAG: hypothetical protein AABX50_00595 [Nanoarchaeota archaeon]
MGETDYQKGDRVIYSEEYGSYVAEVVENRCKPEGDIAYDLRIIREICPSRFGSLKIGEVIPFSRPKNFSLAMGRIDGLEAELAAQE